MSGWLDRVGDFARSQVVPLEIARRVGGWCDGGATGDPYELSRYEADPSDTTYDANYRAGNVDSNNFMRNNVLSGDQTAAWQQALGPTSEYAIAARKQQELDDAARWYGAAAKNRLAYEQAGAAARAAAALAARRAAISKMYDQMLGTLTTNRTNAQGQINASNVALQQALGTIDQRGARQSAALNSALQALFANAINQSRGDYATAMADMGQYGAGPGRMSMTQAEQLGLLRGQAARTRAFGAELGNIRSQAMDTARSQGNLLTSGTRQQLWAEDAAMRAQIERERLAAMARAAGG